MDIPTHYEIIGRSFVLKWADENVDFWDAPFLRKHSPSAEQAGEMDIFGRIRGGTTEDENFNDVVVKNFYPIGNYALRLVFSDGHSTGIYSWAYFKTLRNLKQN